MYYNAKWSLWTACELYFINEYQSIKVLYPSYKRRRPYKRTFDMPTCLVPSGLVWPFCEVVCPLLTLPALSSDAWHHSEHDVTLKWRGVRCNRSTLVCEFSPLRAVSCSGQLVPEQFRSQHVLCMRSSYVSCNIASWKPQCCISNPLTGSRPQRRMWLWAIPVSEWALLSE